MLKSLLDMANEANQLCGVVPATHTERLEHLLRGKASIIAIEDEQLGNVLLGWGFLLCFCGCLRLQRAEQRDLSDIGADLLDWKMENSFLSLQRSSVF
jgi:hypothetical protein